MLPGFVNIFKDTDGFVHLYFFNGIDENEEQIYKDIDLSTIPFKYICLESSEFHKEYKFSNKTIIKIKCKLVNKIDNSVEVKILDL